MAIFDLEIAWLRIATINDHEFAVGVHASTLGC
jgi:hypothetical protein